MYVAMAAIQGGIPEAVRSQSGSGDASVSAAGAVVCRTGRPLGILGTQWIDFGAGPDRGPRGPGAAALKGHALEERHELGGRLLCSMN